MGTWTLGTVQRNSIPVEPWSTPFVAPRSSGLGGASQLGSNQPEPKTKKAAASVPPARGKRDSALAAVRKISPAGAAEETVEAPGAVVAGAACWPDSPGRHQRTD